MINEFPVVIDGNEYILKPTWRVIQRIESALDESVIELAIKVSEGRAKMTDLVDIVFISLKGQDDAPTKDDIGKSFMKTGMVNQMIAVGNFLSCAFAGAEEYQDAIDSSKEDAEEK